jgi:hypothetical protein
MTSGERALTRLAALCVLSGSPRDEQSGSVEEERNTVLQSSRAGRVSALVFEHGRSVFALNLGSAINIHFSIFCQAFATFDRSEWVSQGKKWKDVTPLLKRFCAGVFAIPPSIGSKILPGEGFIVAENGNLARNGAVEDSEFDVTADDLPLAVRRPKRSAKAPRQYEGDEMWDTDSKSSTTH